MSRFNVIAKLVHHREFYSYINGDKPYPLNVEISPSAECNANCQNCLYIQKRYKRHGFIDTAKLIDALACMEHVGVKAITWSGGGEPTLHPDFDRITQSCAIEQGLFTNAINKPVYDPDKFGWIRVTIDKDRLIPTDNLSILRKCKTLGLCINYKHAEYDKLIVSALTVADEIGIDYVQVRPSLVVNGLLTSIVKPELPGFIDHPKLIFSNNKFADCSIPRSYKVCRGFHLVPFIWENGDVDVCGYMRGCRGYNLGNIYKDNFDKIMDHAPDHVPVHVVCQVCCKNHELNRLIDEVISAKDKNFV